MERTKIYLLDLVTKLLMTLGSNINGMMSRNKCSVN